MAIEKSTIEPFDKFLYKYYNRAEGRKEQTLITPDPSALGTHWGMRAAGGRSAGGSHNIIHTLQERRNLGPFHTPGSFIFVGLLFAGPQYPGYSEYRCCHSLAGSRDYYDNAAYGCSTDPAP